MPAIAKSNCADCGHARSQHVPYISLIPCVDLQDARGSCVSCGDCDRFRGDRCTCGHPREHHTVNFGWLECRNACDCKRFVLQRGQ